MGHLRMAEGAVVAMSSLCLAVFGIPLLVERVVGARSTRTRRAMCSSKLRLVLHGHFGFDETPR
eukprot:6377345-Lingulodinium_polyedra.AAC.1